MKITHIVMAVLLMAAAAGANAATYTVQVAWTDPTPTGSAYVPNYTAQCNVNGGTFTTKTALTATAASFTGVTANTGDTISCQVQAINVLNPANPISGPMSALVTAVAPVVGTTPLGQTNISITVTPQ